MGMQHKSVDVQFKTEEKPDGKMRFGGYLSVFGNVDSYGDIVERGAFAKSLESIAESGRVLPILENHGGWKTGAQDVTPIGYFESLKEDQHGLHVSGVLYNTTRGRDVYTILKESPKGSMGMSIGYRVIRSRNATRDEYAKSGVMQYLEELELHEGSIVTFPANKEARVEDVKSDVMMLRTFERALKEGGFNAKDAKTIVSIFKKCGVYSLPEKSLLPPETPSDEMFDVSKLLETFKSSLEEESVIRKSFQDTIEALKNGV